MKIGGDMGVDFFHLVFNLISYDGQVRMYFVTVP